jgi:hypothetical protein
MNKIHSKYYFFIIAILIITINCGGFSKSNEIVIESEKLKLVPGHECDIDRESGTTIQLQNIQTSNYIQDNSGIDYSIESALRGTRLQAWCMNGNGIGEWMKAEIPSNQFMNKGMTNIYRIVIVNGLVANKKLYYANNRVKTIEVDFSEGEKRILKLKDGFFDNPDYNYQQFKISIKARWIKFTIREIYKGNKYNDTCIGKIRLETD